MVDLEAGKGRTSMIEMMVAHDVFAKYRGTKVGKGGHYKPLLNFPNICQRGFIYRCF